MPSIACPLILPLAQPVSRSDCETEPSSAARNREHRQVLRGRTPRTGMGSFIGASPWHELAIFLACGFIL
jgi:hypothetical protein